MHISLGATFNTFLKLTLTLKSFSVETLSASQASSNSFDNHIIIIAVVHCKSLSREVNGRNYPPAAIISLRTFLLRQDYLGRSERWRFSPSSPRFDTRQVFLIDVSAHSQLLKAITDIENPFPLK